MPPDGWSVAADAKRQQDRNSVYASNRSRTPQAEAIFITVPSLGSLFPDKSREGPTRSMSARRASSDTPPCAAATFRNAFISSRGSPSNSSIAAFRYAAMSCGVLRWSLALCSFTGILASSGDMPYNRPVTFLRHESATSWFRRPIESRGLRHRARSWLTTLVGASVVRLRRRGRFSN